MLAKKPPMGWNSWNTFGANINEELIRQTADVMVKEGYLGTKQSHGCIRIQRLKNNEGYNHRWLWKNLPLKTRVIIWDDANRSDSPETWYPNP